MSDLYDFYRVLSVVVIILTITIGFHIYKYQTQKFCILDSCSINIEQPIQNPEDRCNYTFKLNLQFKDLEIDKRNLKYIKYALYLQIADIDHTKIHIQQLCTIKAIPSNSSTLLEWCAKSTIPSGSWDYRFICYNGSDTEWKRMNIPEACSSVKWFSKECSDSNMEYY